MSPLLHQEEKVAEILKRVYVYMSDSHMESVTDEVRQFVEIIEIGVVLNQQGWQHGWSDLLTRLPKKGITRVVRVCVEIENEILGATSAVQAWWRRCGSRVNKKDRFFSGVKEFFLHRRRFEGGAG